MAAVAAAEHDNQELLVKEEMVVVEMAKKLLPESQELMPLVVAEVEQVTKDTQVCPVEQVVKELFSYECQRLVILVPLQVHQRLQPMVLILFLNLQGMEPIQPNG